MNPRFCIQPALATVANVMSAQCWRRHEGVSVTTVVAAAVGGAPNEGGMSSWHEGSGGVQAAVGVVQHGLRPPVPAGTPPMLAEVMHKCWHKSPAARPSFTELVPVLSLIHI